MDHKALAMIVSLCSIRTLAEVLSSASFNLMSLEEVEFRLVGGAHHCEGHLEVKVPGENWSQVKPYQFHRRLGQRVCLKLGCGSVHSIRQVDSESWIYINDCEKKSLSHCFEKDSYSSSVSVKLSCSDSVRLRGSGLCSGLLEVLWDQFWTSICEEHFDLQDAGVVCRELGCGAPSLLQGVLSGEARVLGQMFHCKGGESALMDCPRSSSRDTCSSGTAVELTCSDTGVVQLVDGVGRCDGTVELQHLGQWRAVPLNGWTLRTAAKLCQHLGCGSVLSLKLTKNQATSVWNLSLSCVQSSSSLLECVVAEAKHFWHFLHTLHCSDSVRFSEPQLCSGLLEVLWDQFWASVCEEDFDLQDAEVVCRELGCGAPSFLQGVPSGEARVLGQMFHCEGDESALMDCPRSSSRDTCSSGTAVELTCSDTGVVQLAGGAGRCDGAVELQHMGVWRAVPMTSWTLRAAAALCLRLDCGSLLFLNLSKHQATSVWTLSSPCVQSSSTLLECVMVKTTDIWRPMRNVHTLHDLHCSYSVRLRGSRLCSGLLEVLWDQFWTSICEEDFDLQDAEVVCRELGCGAPSLLKGVLSEEGQPLGQMFHCEGDESALMDCPRSSSRDTCSSGTAVELTCSEAAGVHLVGRASRCAGLVELRLRGEWRRMKTNSWNRAMMASVCQDLNCGHAVSGGRSWGLPQAQVWFVSAECAAQNHPLVSCVLPITTTTESGLEVVCSDLLNRPNISMSVSADGVSQAEPQGLRVLLGSNISVRCSVEAQYPGGSFQLLSPTVHQNHTLPAVNHSAHFLFSDAGPAHKGGYTCVYRLHVFLHDFSSQSETLYLSLGVLDSDLVLRVVIILLLKLIYIPTVYFYCKATRGRQLKRVPIQLFTRESHSD